MQAIVCDCPTQTMQKLPEIFENGAVHTVHICNTFMNLTTYYVQLSLISAAIKQLILPCFVQHEGCSYLKIVACRSR